MEENANAQYTGVITLAHINNAAQLWGYNITTTDNTTSGSFADNNSIDIRDLKNTVKELQNEIAELKRKLRAANSGNEKEHRKLTT